MLTAYILDQQHFAFSYTEYLLLITFFILSR